MHLGFCWFCRIKPSDPVPERTTLVKLRNERWQQELGRVKILEKPIEACAKAGLVSGGDVANAAMGPIEPIEPPLSLRDHLLRRCGRVTFIPPEVTPAPEKPKDDDLRPGAVRTFAAKPGRTRRTVRPPTRRRCCTERAPAPLHSSPTLVMRPSTRSVGWCWPWR